MRESTQSGRAPQVHAPWGNRRAGNIVVLSAFVMIVLFAMMAFAVDIGYILTARTEIQRAVDAAALAGAGVLVQGQNEAEVRALEYLVRNPVGKSAAVSEEQLAQAIAEFQTAHEDDFEISVGNWNPDTGDIEPTADLPSTIKVSFELKNQPLFFGPMLHRDTFSVRAESIAMFHPRDIVLIIDLSGSMNDDTELKSIGTFPEEEIHAGLLKCYQDLGSPQYATVLEFEPNWITVEGNPATSTTPQFWVEYRYDDVKVSSTTKLKKVVLDYANTNYDQTFYTSGTYDAESNRWVKVVEGNGNRIEEVQVQAYAPVQGAPKYTEVFDFHSNTIDQTIKSALDLDNVAYPYNGSWESYFSHCRSSNNANAQAGFRYKFGYENLINYWLEQKCRKVDTPDLYKCSAQPIASVRESVDVFMDYIREVDTDDRVGLAVYNATDGDGQLESELTTELETIETLANGTQAGHYHDYTNIGGGMTTAREEIADNGRPGAFKYMVLMTDGQANWVNGQYDPEAARQYVLDEAQLAAAAKIPIVTISLGANADADLMQQVADITNGTHFNVPGGQTAAEYTEDLLEVFRAIADDRPLKIVK